MRFSGIHLSNFVGFHDSEISDDMVVYTSWQLQFGLMKWIFVSLFHCVSLLNSHSKETRMLSTYLSNIVHVDGLMFEGTWASAGRHDTDFVCLECSLCFTYSAKWCEQYGEKCCSFYIIKKLLSAKLLSARLSLQVYTPQYFNRVILNH